MLPSTVGYPESHPHIEQIIEVEDGIDPLPQPLDDDMEPMTDSRGVIRSDRRRHGRLPHEEEDGDNE